MELDRVKLGHAAGLLGRVEGRVAERREVEDTRRAGLTLLVAGLARARRLVAVDAVRNLGARLDRADRVTTGEAAADEDESENAASGDLEQVLGHLSLPRGCLVLQD